MNIRIILFISILPFLFFGLLASEEEWELYKTNVLESMDSFSGWCSKEKALLMMDLIKEHQLERCVEVGVFRGSSLFSIVKTVQYNGQGEVYGIDAWDSEIAVRGLDPQVQKVDYDWWSSLDLETFYLETFFLFRDNGLMGCCQLLRATAETAANFFADDSIDFIHFDGNHSAKYSLQEILAFFPKVKEGGYILLNDASWTTLTPCLVFLLERTESKTDIMPNMPFALFQKTQRRLDGVKKLLLEGE